MKTKISSQRGQYYELVVVEKVPANERRVLAAMTLFEGTGLWMVTDIRLHRHRRPSPYSGGLFADDIHCSYTAKNKRELAIAKGLLREYTEYGNGRLEWSTFEGLVKGPRQEEPTSFGNHNGIGYFSRTEGLDYLREVQAFWEQCSDDPENVKIHNPYRQPSEMMLEAKIQASRSSKA